tara:strand:+ start:521 stop:991 length:471 start_codon:yes stop_codon:yes gene_type:complete
MTWFSILKETKLVSSQGIRTKLGTSPLTMGDDDDELSCCEIAVDAYEDVIVEYSHMEKNETQRRWAEHAWENYISVLKRTGSYNTWPVQEHLEHRKGGLNEETCDDMWFYLAEDIAHMGDYIILGDSMKEVESKLKQINDDWVECMRSKEDLYDLV